MVAIAYDAKDGWEASVTTKKLPVFQCLECHEGLVSSKAKDAADELKCPKCERAYPVVNNIPRFVSADNYAHSFGFQWNVHRETQLDSYTGITMTRDRVFSVTGWPQDMKGQTILEAGSGAGRFTEILAGTGAELYSFDYSTACEANYKNNGSANNLHLFQGDIYKIPFAEGSFDKVFCLGVIQHTPDPDEAFHHLARQVRPGGELVIDSYGKRLISLMQWKYLLRPITKRMNPEKLYRIIERWVPRLLPTTIFLRKNLGKLGAKLSPIVEFSYLDLPYDLHVQWSILDTFDWYAPAHDHPRSIKEITKWYEDAGFVDIHVGLGPNGFIARGRRPE